MKNLNHSRAFGLIFGLGALALSGLACGGGAETSAPAESSEDAIIGVTNLQRLEALFSLKSGAVDDATLQRGACYHAFVHDPNSASEWAIYPEFEYRRYANGVAFFAKKDSGLNSNDYRPVVCLDVHEGTRSYSLSGVALDAVGRYGLGPAVKIAQSGAKTTLEFPRGKMEFTEVGTRDARFEAARTRPTLVRIEDAPTVYGRLDKLEVYGVYTEHAYGEPEHFNLPIPGHQAFFTYRYAWRQAENSNAFRDESDPFGTLESSSDGGDGPGWWSSHHFQKLSSSYVGMWDSYVDANVETLSVHPLGQDTWGESRPPLAECTRKIGFDPATETELPEPFTCTGI